MDEHKRYELCGEAGGGATYACVRSRDVLHHVQPVRDSVLSSWNPAMIYERNVQRTYWREFRAGVHNDTVYAPRLDRNPRNGMQPPGRT